MRVIDIIEEDVYNDLVAEKNNTAQRRNKKMYDKNKTNKHRNGKKKKRETEFFDY